LLRVLQDRRFERVGGSRTLQSDVRWVSATNRDIDALRETGRFRDDLYHRLAVFPIRIPPLRERKQDILPLAGTLIERVSREVGRTGLDLSDDTRDLIVRSPWPGNIRELANALERAAILAEGNVIRPEHLQIERPIGGRLSTSSLDELERAAIEDALAASGGNRREAAERLGIGLRTLYDKLKKYRDQEG
jgi:two-component system response regulator FlrC